MSSPSTTPKNTFTSMFLAPSMETSSTSASSSCYSSLSMSGAGSSSQTDYTPESSPPVGKGQAGFRATTLDTPTYGSLKARIAYLKKIEDEQHSGYESGSEVRDSGSRIKTQKTSGPRRVRGVTAPVVSSSSHSMLSSYSTSTSTTTTQKKQKKKIAIGLGMGLPSSDPVQPRSTTISASVPDHLSPVHRSLFVIHEIRTPQGLRSPSVSLSTEAQALRKCVLKATLPTDSPSPIMSLPPRLVDTTAEEEYDALPLLPSWALPCKPNLTIRRSSRENTPPLSAWSPRRSPRICSPLFNNKNKKIPRRISPCCPKAKRLAPTILDGGISPLELQSSPTIITSSPRQVSAREPVALRVDTDVQSLPRSNNAFPSSKSQIVSSLAGSRNISRSTSSSVCGLGLFMYDGTGTGPVVVESPTSEVGEGGERNSVPSPRVSPVVPSHLLKHLALSPMSMPVGNQRRYQDPFAMESLLKVEDLAVLTLAASANGLALPLFR